MGELNTKDYLPFPPELQREGDLEPPALSGKKRVELVLITSLGLFSVLYFADFWFLSEARRDPVFFAALSFAVFWGAYRSLVNWGIYFFIHNSDLKAAKPVNSANMASDDGSVELDSPKYTVDVLTTAMPGEPFDMFKDTLHAIQAMQTPHNTYLLDGGNDPALIKLCDSLGVNHINCMGIQGAKAGKINFCLEHHASGNVVFIVDPDHRPRQDVLQRALPFFEKAEIGFVQIVQAYYNGNQSFVANCAAEQTYGFYGPTLMGLNGLGIPTAIGANCIFRRQALDSVGGHAVHLAEDALTSMRIHARGWKSAYLPYRGTSGLVPDDLAGFFKQQYKWATGMFYLLFHEYPRLFKHFDWPARIHYFNAGTFYLNGLATFLILLLPIWFLFRQIYAVEFPLAEFLGHVAPYALTTMGTYIFVQGWYTHKTEKRFPWRSLTLEKGSWHVYLMAFFSLIFNRRVEYLPTPKSSQKQSSPGLVVPHIIAIVLSISAILWATFTYHRLDEGSLLMMGFATLNVIFLLPTTIVALFPSLNWRNSHES